MSLIPPHSVQKLPAALHAKAKGSPHYRFYALYDKVYRKDILCFAYGCCKSNKGAAGVDGQSFEDIEKYGLERWLGELTQEPAKKRIQRICAAIGQVTDRRGTGQDTGEVVIQLNRMMTGWANYFCLGPVSNAYRARLDSTVLLLLVPLARIKTE